MTHSHLGIMLRTVANKLHFNIGKKEGNMIIQNIDFSNEIKSKKDIESFIDNLINAKVSFHPDDDFNDYVNENNIKSFTSGEASHLNKLMDQCHQVDGDYLEVYMLKKIEE